jgi:hypothetical protein
MFGSAALSRQNLPMRNGHPAYSESFPKDFFVVMDTDKPTFENALENRRYSPLTEFQRFLPIGKQTIHISVRDKWNNKLEEHISGWVIPGVTVATVLIFLFLWLATIFVVLVAPFCNFANGLIMNPWIRRFGSGFAAPVALSVFPLVRRYLLHRYVRNIRLDRDFADWRTRYVIPSETFPAERFRSQIEPSRKLLLLGESGIGKTSYFKYLTSYFASAPGNYLSTKKVIPVFLPVERYAGAEPSEMFHNQLANFGGFSDTVLTTWCLQQGGFLILIDGLNEVDEGTRKKLNGFVDRHWKANYFYLSSQVAYPEFSWIENVELADFGSEKVNELIRRRFNKDKADKVINNFTTNAYEICRIPQHLEFVIDLIEVGHDLPHSLDQLYEAKLSPIFESWVKNGTADYPALLFSRAFEMLCSRDPCLDRSLPDHLLNPLIEYKLVIKQGQHYYFRHDSVRAYLAANHVADRWQDVLREGRIVVDDNWLQMLEFVVLRLNRPDAAKNLVLAILQKNRNLSGNLFKSIKRSRSGLVLSWEDDFNREYGKLTLA